MITGWKKIMVHKRDNFKKYDDKRVCREDGVPFSHLKKGDTFIKKDCKYLQCCKLWAGNKLKRWQIK